MTNKPIATVEPELVPLKCSFCDDSKALSIRVVSTKSGLVAVCGLCEMKIQKQAYRRYVEAESMKETPSAAK